MQHCPFSCYEVIHGSITNLISFLNSNLHVYTCLIFNILRLVFLEFKYEIIKILQKKLSSILPNFQLFLGILHKPLKFVRPLSKLENKKPLCFFSFCKMCHGDGVQVQKSSNQPSRSRFNSQSPNYTKIFCTCYPQSQKSKLDHIKVKNCLDSSSFSQTLITLPYIINLLKTLALNRLFLYKKLLKIEATPNDSPSSSDSCLDREINAMLLGLKVLLQTMLLLVCRVVDLAYSPGSGSSQSPGRSVSCSCQTNGPVQGLPSLNPCEVRKNVLKNML